MTLYVFLNWYFWPSSHYTILLLERIKHNSNWKRLSYNCQIPKCTKLRSDLNEAFLLSWNIFVIARESIPGLIIESCNTCLKFNFGKTNAIRCSEKIWREKMFLHWALPFQHAWMVFHFVIPQQYIWSMAWMKKSVEEIIWPLLKLYSQNESTTCSEPVSMFHEASPFLFTLV